MIYADYTYYRVTYGGTKIPEEDFRRAAIKASVDIDYYTNGKAKDAYDTPQVKMCCCELADAAYSYDKICTAAEQAPGIASERVGDYSVSYRGTSEIVTEAGRTYDSTVKATCDKYLMRTGLLYRGVCHV